MKDVLTWIELVTKLTVDCAPPITVPTILAIIAVESAGDPNAINLASGATGLMQVMPREANPKMFHNRPTQEELLDPETNIRWGIRILKHSMVHDVSLKPEPALVRGLYRYSGGSYWKSWEEYMARYWCHFESAREKIQKKLDRNEANDG